MWPVTAPPAAPSEAPRATARPSDLALFSSSCTNASFVSLIAKACRASLGLDGSETRLHTKPGCYLPFVFGDLSPIWRTLPNRSLSGIPDNVSNNAGIFAAIDFRFLHLDLLFFFDLHDLHLLGNDLLLHDVGLDVVGFVGLGLLFLGDFEILRLFYFEVALGFGLLGLGNGFRQHAFLVGLRSGYRRFPRCDGAPDGSIAIGFGGGDVGVALDSGDIRTSHVGDVLVLVADFLDGE